MDSELKVHRGKTETCSVCKKDQSIYCCPRCFIKTCSLDCCLTHKKSMDCNGKRDRTKYICKEEFSANMNNLVSDYHFLEDALLVNRRAKRFMRENDHGASKSKNAKKRRFVERNLDQKHYSLPKQNWFQERLDEQKSNCSAVQNHLMVNASIRSNINVVFMSNGMEKRKRNKSFFHIKKDKLYWTIEFTFHDVDCISKAKVTIDRVDDNNILHDELKITLEKHCKSNNPIIKLFSEQINFHKEVNFFLKVEPSSDDQVRYHKIDGTLPLRDALKGLNIVEFPTIQVAFTKCDHLFPRKIELI